MNLNSLDRCVQSRESFIKFFTSTVVFALTRFIGFSSNFINNESDTIFCLFRELPLLIIINLYETGIGRDGFYLGIGSGDWPLYQISNDCHTPNRFHLFPLSTLFRHSRPLSSVKIRYCSFHILIK